MGTVIFEGIIDNIHQDLLQVQRISNQSAMLQSGLIQLQPDFFLLGLGVQNRNTVFQCVMKVKGFFHLCLSSAHQPAHLKDIVHQRKQMLC